jgi:hypothetical protein
MAARSDYLEMQSIFARDAASAGGTAAVIAATG